MIKKDFYFISNGDIMGLLILMKQYIVVRIASATV